jgi:tetratricopeptide (TPR) repeat protein
MTTDLKQQLERAAAAGDEAAMLEAGAAAIRAGRDADIVETVEAILRDRPDFARLWQLLGLVRRNLDDHAGSLEAFAKAAELAPDDPMIAHGHATVRFEAGLPAAREFERAAQLAPTNRAIIPLLAAAEIAEGRQKAAITRLDEATARDPLWVEGHKALTRQRWAAGDRDNFAASFERALIQAPREADLWRGYVSTLAHDELHEPALAVIARARAAVGADRAFDLSEAVCRCELGDLEAAAALLGRLAPLRDVAEIVTYLRVLLKAGQVEQAAQVAENSVPNDPSHQVWPYLSVAWRQLGDSRWEWLEGDPSFVGVHDIADSLPSLDLLAEHLRGLHRSAHHPLYQSLRGGTQTDGHLFQRIEPEIRSLRDAIVRTVERYVAGLPAPRPGHPLLIEKRSPIRFSGSWSVRLTGAGFHVAHCHPAGWISSAFYVALPDAAMGGPDHAGWLSLGEVSNLGKLLPPLQLVEPRPGRLVLFPSTMWHGTRPFQSGERLTVAFDVQRPG